MAEDAELLINLRSRSSGREIIRLISMELEKQGIRLVTVHTISRKVKLSDAMKTIITQPPKLLILAGGDGTLSSCIDALVGTSIEIGIIPLGTTNNIARSLGLPQDLENAVKVISEKKARHMDLGRVNDDYFANVAGIGLSAELADRVTNKLKKRWGRLAYFWVGLRTTISFKPFFVTIKDPDNELSVTYETRQVIVANGKYHAGTKIADDVRITNGQLVIFTLGGRSLLSFIHHNIDFYFGTRKKVAHASYLVGRNVKINTSTPQQIELDGEVRSSTPVSVRVEAAQVKVRY